MEKPNLSIINENDDLSIHRVDRYIHDLYDLYPKLAKYTIPNWIEHISSSPYTVLPKNMCPKNTQFADAR